MSFNACHLIEKLVKTASMTTQSVTPKHVAFIMDGNGRWAKSRGWKRLEGHKAGVKTVRSMIEESIKRNIEVVTFYAFSSENWKRPEEEVSGLFRLMKEYFRKEMKSLQEQNICVKFIGNRAPGCKLSQDIIDLMNAVEEQTADNTAITANFAINYGGRNELMRAAIEFTVNKLESTEDHVDFTKFYHEESLGQFLDTGPLPEVDLMIRTGGEKRISNFMLWQLAYAELAFPDVAWPDFAPENYQAVLDDFASRQRRFGGLVQSQEVPSEVIPTIEDVEVL